jgi:hypothetical protein
MNFMVNVLIVNHPDLLRLNNMQLNEKDLSEKGWDTSGSLTFDE